MKKHSIEDAILYENDDVLAFNKPSGISTLKDRSDTNNVLSKVRELHPKIKNCHRLDKYTSGVLLFAKNLDTYRLLSRQFEARTIRKTYHALVHGITEYHDFEVHLPLLIRGNGRVVWDKREGKPSNTTFTTMQNFKEHSLLKCIPVTGRKHQIRVHLQYANHPIVADQEYGGNMIYLSELKRNYNVSKEEERPIIDRMALHAFSIRFDLPDQKSVNIEAPYPKDLQILLKQLGKYGI
jgi:23S rRNA pseudouridine955/2504/2580 synthase